MKIVFKILKVTGITIVILILSGAIFYLYVSAAISRRAGHIYEFSKDSLVIQPTAEMIKRGAHLAEIKGCTDCHGQDLGGKLVVKDGSLGIIAAPNLTRGQNGIGKNYSILAWMMALRHGVDTTGRPLLLMPSHETALLSKEDLRALIAYCDQLPPVDRELPANKIGPVFKVMGFFDKVPLFSAEKINHELQPAETTSHIVGAAMGQYLSVSCSGCHRANLKGGEPLAPGMKAAPDITSSGNVGKWSFAGFQKTLRTGITPAGHVLNNDDMPWQMTAKYTDEELESLYIYLRSLK